MRVFIALFALVLVLGSCPNNCNGHGVCKDNVCECNKGSINGGGSDENYLYYGADCSIKACPLGNSFSSFLKVALPDGSSTENNGGRLLKSLNISRCEDGKVCDNTRLLGNSSLTRVLNITSTNTSLSDYYEVSGVEYPLLKKDGGELVCKSEIDEYVGKMKVIGKTKNNSFIMKIPKEMILEGEDISSIFVKYNCFVSFSYDDYSLINPTISESNKITWSGMKTILNNVGIKIETSGVKFACLKDKELKVYETKQATAERQSENDIEFSFTDGPSDGLICYYLGKDGVVADSDISKVNSLQLNNGKDIGLSNGKKLYEIYKFEPKPSSNYALLNCFNNYTNELIGKTYLMGYDSVKDISKVVYDFELDDYDSYDLKCEIIEEYSEITSLYPIVVENDEGKITNTGVKEIIDELNVDHAVEVVLGCYNPESRIFNPYLYSYDSVNGVFTIKTSPRRNLADVSNPVRSDICYILMNGETLITILSDANKAVSFFNKHLTLSGEADKYKYYDENSVVYLPGERVVDNIYILENITFNVGKSGVLIECTNVNNVNDIIEIQILEKIDDDKLNKYYVRYNNNKIGNGEYKCELIHQTNDLSLYELTKPSDCKSKDGNGVVAKCDLTLISMSYFLTKLPKEGILGDGDVKIACSRGDSIEIYDYTCNAVADGNTVDKTKDVNFTIKDNSIIVPSNNDICHIIAYTSKTVRRERRLTDVDDLTALMNSDYGKSLSNVDIGKMNNKVYKLYRNAEADKTRQISTVNEITISKNKDNYYQIEVPISKIASINDKYFAKNQIPIPIEDSVDGRNLLSQISLGRTVEIKCVNSVTSVQCHTTGISKVIIGIEKVDNIPTSRRLLFENERILAGTLSGVILQFNSLGSSGLDGNTASYTVTFSKSTDSIVTHGLIECSGVGICDRENGVCNCYEGFSGSACERMSCPNNCNNHGRCINNKELTSKIDGYSGFGNDVVDKIYGCLCDSGYRGVDCSLKECPSKTDVQINDRDCSNHGLCDYTSGTCNCFSGYYGEACQHSIETS